MRLVVGRLLVVVGDQGHRDDLHVRVERGDRALGLHAHAHHGAAGVEHQALVADGLEVGAAEHDVGPHVELVALAQCAVRLEMPGRILVDACGGVDEFTGEQGHGVRAPAHEVGDVEEVAHAQVAPQGTSGAGEDELLHPELDEHLDLQAHHEADVRVERVLVHVDATAQDDHALGLAVDLDGAQLQATLVPLQFVELAEGTDLGQAHGVRGLEGEGITPARAQHDGRVDLLVMGQVEAVTQVTLTFLQHAFTRLVASEAVVICPFHQNLQSCTSATRP